MNKLNLKDMMDQKIVYIIHRAYLNQRVRSSQFSRCTKTRSEVKGGGRKPWKQKGTGRARAGSKSSPLWRGGGVTFGPKPIAKDNKINKKEKRKALLNLLKAKQKSIILFSNLNIFDKVSKTKELLKILEILYISQDKKIGILYRGPNKNLYLASRNLKNIKLLNIYSLNIIDILALDYLIVDKLSIKGINKFYKI